MVATTSIMEHFTVDAGIGMTIHTHRSPSVKVLATLRVLGARCLNWMGAVHRRLMLASGGASGPTQVIHWPHSSPPHRPPTGSQRMGGWRLHTYIHTYHLCASLMPTSPPHRPYNVPPRCDCEWRVPLSLPLLLPSHSHIFPHHLISPVSPSASSLSPVPLATSASSLSHSQSERSPSLTLPSRLAVKPL